MPTWHSVSSLDADFDLGLDRTVLTLEAPTTMPQIQLDNHEAPPVPEEAFLPAELEREIFEISALSRPSSIPNLMLIARHVKEWVEPLLYRIIFLSARNDLDGCPPFSVDRLVDQIEQKPAAFFEKAVHHLFLDNLNVTSEHTLPESALATILSACCGVTDIFMNVSTAPTLPLLGRITSLRRLGASMNKLFYGIPVDFTHGLFRHLTHLEVFDSVGDSEVLWDGLSLIPNLTHFGFHSESLLAISGRVMQTCPKLQYLVFVVLFEGDVMFEEVQHRCGDLADDPRFVVTIRSDFRTEWQLGAYRGTDFWYRCEEFVARKRARQVDRLQYFCGTVSDDEDTV
ncbi:hypothetical protein DFH09DRAFT_1461921 [Mycena vulgaris]|nr:hypothetical protein DFH09DRAFT_1461921 [Mycena vulgaris]